MPRQYKLVYKHWHREGTHRPHGVGALWVWGFTKHSKILEFIVGSFGLFSDRRQYCERSGCNCNRGALNYRVEVDLLSILLYAVRLK